MVVTTVTARLVADGKDVIAWLKTIQRNRIPEASEQLTFQLAKDIRDTARRNVKERTVYGGKSPGQLSASIVAIKAPTGRFNKAYNVVADTSYARAVEKGTKAHEIPNNPYWGLVGRKHPGARPMWFMRDALNEELNILTKRIDEAFDARRWR